MPVGVVVVVLLLPPLPPQPLIPIVTSVKNSAGMQIARSLRSLRLRQPAIGTSRNDRNAPAITTAALTLLLIVRVEVAAVVPLGVTLVGLKVQFELAGRPEQANVVAPLKPLIGVTVTVTVAGVPAVKVPLVDDIDRLKSAGGGALTVMDSADDVEVRLLLSPP